MEELYSWVNMIRELMGFFVSREDVERWLKAYRSGLEIKSHPDRVTVFFSEFSNDDENKSATRQVIDQLRNRIRFVDYKEVHRGVKFSKYGDSDDVVVGEVRKVTDVIRSNAMHICLAGNVLSPNKAEIYIGIRGAQKVVMRKFVFIAGQHDQLASNVQDHIIECVGLLARRIGVEVSHLKLDEQGIITAAGLVRLSRGVEAELDQMLRRSDTPGDRKIIESCKAEIVKLGCSGREVFAASEANGTDKSLVHISTLPTPLHAFNVGVLVHCARIHQAVAALDTAMLQESLGEIRKRLPLLEHSETRANYFYLYRIYTYGYMFSLMVEDDKRGLKALADELKAKIITEKKNGKEPYLSALYISRLEVLYQLIHLDFKSERIEEYRVTIEELRGNIGLTTPIGLKCAFKLCEADYYMLIAKVRIDHEMEERARVLYEEVLTKMNEDKGHFFSTNISVRACIGAAAAISSTMTKFDRRSDKIDYDRAIELINQAEKISKQSDKRTLFDLWIAVERCAVYIGYGKSRRDPAGIETAVRKLSAYKHGITGRVHNAILARYYNCLMVASFYQFQIKTTDRDVNIKAKDILDRAKKVVSMEKYFLEYALILFNYLLLLDEYGKVVHSIDDRAEAKSGLKQLAMICNERGLRAYGTIIANMMRG